MEQKIILSVGEDQPTTVDQNVQPDMYQICNKIMADIQEQKQKNAKDKLKYEEIVQKWTKLIKDIEESDKKLDQLHSLMVFGLKDTSQRAIMEQLRTKVLNELGYNSESEGWPYDLAQQEEENFCNKFRELFNSELTDAEFTLLATPYQSELPDFKGALAALSIFGESTARKFFSVAYPNETFEPFM